MKVEIHPLILFVIILLFVLGDRGSTNAEPERSITPPPRPGNRRRAADRIRELNIDFEERVRSHMEAVHHDG